MKSFWALFAFLFLTSCGGGGGQNTTRSVFYHDEEVIRLNHQNKSETVLMSHVAADASDAQVTYGPFKDDIVKATPILVYVQQASNPCPGSLVGTGIVGCFVPQNADEWCDIFALVNNEPDKLSPGRGRIATAGDGFDLGDFDRHCYQDVTANSSHSVVAASLVARSVGELEINGLLVVRSNDSWRAFPDIPGWQPLSPAVRNPAVNNAGSDICFDMGSKVYCGPVADPATATECGDGRMPQFGTLGGESVVAWHDSDRFRAAELTDCSQPVFSSNPHSSGTIKSMNWNEFGSKLVYILDTGSSNDVYEYDFSSNTHDLVISDSRDKSSISIMRN